MNPIDFNHWLTNPRRRTLVMGILNITPDSFSDGGKFAARDAALAHAEAMAAEGADWIDVGAESTKPGSVRVSADEQLSRLEPILAELRRRVNVILSIDTTQPAVAEGALESGFDVINDISAGRDSAQMLPLAARRHCPIILMHMQGTPATMQQNPQYQNVTAEVADFLQARRDDAIRAGIEPRQILFDPGIGFGKTMQHNLQLLRELPQLAALHAPIVIGVSRKWFLGKITGESAESGRRFGTAASVAWCVANGAAVVRVHEVGPMKAVVQMIEAIQDGRANL